MSTTDNNRTKAFTIRINYGKLILPTGILFWSPLMCWGWLWEEAVLCFTRNICLNPKARSTICCSFVSETTLTTLYILRSWYSLLKILTKETKNKVFISKRSAQKQVLSMQNSEEAKKPTVWCFSGYMNIWEAWNKSVLEFCNRMTGMSCVCQIILEHLSFTASHREEEQICMVPAVCKPEHVSHFISGPLNFNALGTISSR